MLGEAEVPSFGFRTVGTGTVKTIIHGLKNTGSLGRDGISTQVLKKFSNVLSPAVRHVINRSILTSCFPDGFKHGRIRPLPKKGSLKEPSNWRPVVLNTSLSKALENVLNSQLKDHLEDTGLMSQVQHAYRRHRSCQSAWLEIDTIVQGARNRGKHALILATDQSAAFNLVKKEIILSKLKVFGVDKPSARLICSYLTGRSTECLVGDAVSPHVHLASGVGEGSVVGPLFFIATLCDVTVLSERAKNILQIDHEMDVEVHLIAYADDISAVLVADTERELQTGVDVMMTEFEEYFSSAGLKMNPSKSELIVFRCGKQQSILNVRGQEEATQMKLLGVTVEKNFVFNKHANMVAATVRDKVEKLSKISSSLDYKNLKAIAEALVMSTLTYCLAVWGSRQAWRKKCQVAMNTAVRLICGGDRRMSISDALDRLEWANMDNTWRLEQVMALRRLCESKNSALMYEVIVSQTNHRYMIRQDGLKTGWRPKNNYGLNAFMYTAVQYFNEMRVGQRLWYNDRENRAMTRQEIRSEIKKDLMYKYGNENLH